MKFISTRIHGVLDYLVGILLIISPWLFNFSEEGFAVIVPITLGIITIIYSVMTDYEMGILNLISMKTHLLFDILSGVFLAVSPWLLGFSDYMYAPHLI